MGKNINQIQNNAGTHDEEEIPNNRKLKSGGSRTGKGHEKGHGKIGDDGAIDNCGGDDEHDEAQNACEKP